MNERIRLLALQARLGPALLLHHWGKIDALTDSEQEDLERLEKFAQLIVKECAQVCRDQPNYYALKKDRDNCAVAIEEHFGVEE